MCLGGEVASWKILRWDENEVFACDFLAVNGLIQGSSRAGWGVKKSICVGVKMLFDLEFEGHAAGGFPSSLNITKSA